MDSLERLRSLFPGRSIQDNSRVTGRVVSGLKRSHSMTHSQDFRSQSLSQQSQSLAISTTESPLLDNVGTNERFDEMIQRERHAEVIRSFEDLKTNIKAANESFQLKQQLISGQLEQLPLVISESLVEIHQAVLTTNQSPTVEDFQLMMSKIEKLSNGLEEVKEVIKNNKPVVKTETECDKESEDEDMLNVNEYLREVSLKRKRSFVTYTQSRPRISESMQEDSMFEESIIVQSKKNKSNCHKGIP